MEEAKLTGRPLNLVHSVVWLANEFPSKRIGEVAGMLRVSPLDLNNAIWRAQDMGFFTVDEVEQNEELSAEQQAEENLLGGAVTIHEIPDEWDLGPEIEQLKQEIIFTFKRLARQEADVEENYYDNLTAGYPPYQVKIATKMLLNDKVLSKYEIKDQVEVQLSKKKKGKGQKPEIREEIYTFFTLWENNEHRWGAKQFKNQDQLK